MNHKIEKLRLIALSAMTLLLCGCGGGGGGIAGVTGFLFGGGSGFGSGSGGAFLASTGGVASIGQVATIVNPEPTTMLLMGSGVAVMGYYQTLKNRNRKK